MNSTLSIAFSFNVGIIHSAFCTTRASSREHAYLCERDHVELIRNHILDREIETKDACHRINEHTKVIYNTSSLKAFEPEIFESNWLPWRRIMTDVKNLHAIFQHSSHQFRVETIDIESLFANFKFVHKFTNMKIMMKIKDKHCLFELKKENVYMRHFQ